MRICIPSSERSSVATTTTATTEKASGWKCMIAVQQSCKQQERPDPMTRKVHFHRFFYEPAAAAAAAC